MKKLGIRNYSLIILIVWSIYCLGRQWAFGETYEAEGELVIPRVQLNPRTEKAMPMRKWFIKRTFGAKW